MRGDVARQCFRIDSNSVSTCESICLCQAIHLRLDWIGSLPCQVDIIEGLADKCGFKVSYVPLVVISLQEEKVLLILH